MVNEPGIFLTVEECSLRLNVERDETVEQVERELVLGQVRSTCKKRRFDSQEQGMNQ